jgi:hypothetical protein
MSDYQRRVGRCWLATPLKRKRQNTHIRHTIAIQLTTVVPRALNARSVALQTQYSKRTFGSTSNAMLLAQSSLRNPPYAILLTQSSLRNPPYAILLAQYSTNARSFDASRHSTRTRTHTHTHTHARARARTHTHTHATKVMKAVA